jgi:hypothetical protein
MASVCTRAYYKIGRWTSTVEENWVAEWFLWHSFRFRDNQNRQASAQHTQKSTGREAAISGALNNGESLLQKSVRNEVTLVLPRYAKSPVLDNSALVTQNVSLSLCQLYSKPSLGRNEDICYAYRFYS